MYRILVVDDEKEIIKVLEEFLSKIGYEVIIALGGKKAIEIIDSNVPLHGMVVDLKMPEIDGYEVLKKLKETGREIPVIILSGMMEEEKNFTDLRKLGYKDEDILYKPIDPYQLSDMIKKKLPKKSG